MPFHGIIIGIIVVVIRKALGNTIEQLLKLDTPLWIQVGGMSVSISLGVIVFSTVPSEDSTLQFLLLLLVGLFIVLFSIATFSIYLAKIAANRADKLGLRKTMGATGWALFLETSVQTTFLMLLSILFSTGIIDVTLSTAGLNFGAFLQSLGVLHYGLMLLVVFIVSEGMLFIIQGVALAPNAQSEFEATALYEKSWFSKLANVLIKLSLTFGLLVFLSLVILLLATTVPIKAAVLYFSFFGLLASWWIINKQIRTTKQP